MIIDNKIRGSYGPLVTAITSSLFTSVANDRLRPLIPPLTLRNEPKANDGRIYENICKIRPSPLVTLRSEGP